tara:strand:+ start:23942 stop:25336 length:1395 start_codon:yes stop_codon:yes gene_type:complete
MQRGNAVLRGLFSGGLWGLVVGGVSLGAASLITEQPAGNTPPAAPQMTAQQNAVVPDQGSEPEAALAQDDVVGAVQAPKVVVPQVEITQPMADVISAGVPRTAVVADDMMTPQMTDVTPTVQAATEEPVLPNPQSIAPQVPAAEQDLTVSTQPAPVPVPVVVEDKPVAAAPLVDIPVPMPKAPIKAPAEEIAIAVPALIAPANPELGSNLPTGDASVKVNRIVTDAAPDTPKEASAPIANDAPALVRFATRFENVDAKPLMAIVLIDDGSMNGAVSALSALPFPVTVVLNPSAPDVGAKMVEYRRAGIEVGVLAALPVGATAANVEVAFEATFAVLPDTVLMLDAGNGGLQNDRAVTDQAMALLGRDGRGLVTLSKGLNMALRAAEGADVPAAAVYRDLDGEGQDARVIRRFLDQAAFRARQESGVTLLGRVRPDTISALILWGTANRAGQVVLAPASAVLSGQ